MPLKESKNMNKFETPQEQLKNTAEETEKLKQGLELLLNNPEENKEEILTLTNELKALSRILEKEVEKIEETLSFLRENPEEIETETRFFILKALSKDENEYVRTNVAKNPNTSPEILEKLSQDDDNWVRESVALNPNTPPEILEELSQDKNDSTRAYIALNPNTPLHVLKKLSQDNALNIRIPALNRIKNMKRAI